MTNSTISASELLGWSTAWETTRVAFLHSHKGLDALLPGRVARVDRDSCIVYSASGRGALKAMRAGITGALRHRARSAADLPAVGDWVLLAANQNGAGGLVHAILPRRTCVERGAAGVAPAERSGGAAPRQVIAANVDVLLICCGLDGDFNISRIERYVTVAYNSGAAPVILLNKADACAAPAEQLTAVEQVAIGVPVILVSALHGTQTDAVRALLPRGVTGALVGSSGVGKSTLINRLLGREAMATGPVRSSDSRGRHTTTHRELLLLPEGGLIIDTPGMRELALAADQADVSAAFADIAGFARHCRFRDCRHESEPGCGVLQALAAGELAPRRLESYRKQLREAHYFETRDDPAARAAERDRWKTIHKAAQKWYRQKYRM